MNSAFRYCSRCGVPVDAAYRFCSRCGAALLPTRPVVPAPGRMERHVQILGILLVVWGILSFAGLVAIVVAGAVGVFLGHLTRIWTSEMAGLSALLVVIGTVLVLASVLTLVAGVGLLQYCEWARVLALVLCVLALVRPPFGTLIGIYGLWVLLSREGEQHYRQRIAGSSLRLRA